MALVLLGRVQRKLTGAMIDALFSQANYVAAKRMLDVSALRHQAIASNISNIETPLYRRVDIAPAFANQLREAIASGDSARISALTPTLTPDDKAVAVRADGNTVNIEQEMARMTQNTVESSLETHLITGRLLKIRAAITGKVG